MKTGLTKLNDPIVFDDTLELARLATDQCDWAAYIWIQGGPQKNRPVRLAKIWSDELGLYDEPKGERILGVTCGISTVVTRIHTWKIGKDPLQSSPTADIDLKENSQTANSQIRKFDFLSPWILSITVRSPQYIHSRAYAIATVLRNFIR